MSKDREPSKKRQDNQKPALYTNVEGILIPSNLAGLTSRDFQGYQKVVDTLLQVPDLPPDTVQAFGEALPVIDVISRHLTQQEEIQDLRDRAYGRNRDERRYSRREFLDKIKTAAKIAVPTIIGVSILGTCSNEVYNHEFSPEARSKRAAAELAQKETYEATRMLGLGSSDISATGWTVQLPPDNTQFIPTNKPAVYISYDKSDYEFIEFQDPNNSKKKDNTDITLKTYISSEGNPMTEIHIITQEGDSSQIEKKQYKLLPIEVGADGIATSGVIEMENQNTGDTEYAEINPIQGSPNHFKVTEVQKQTE